MYDNINRLLVVDTDCDATEAIRQIGGELDYSHAAASEPREFLRLIDEFQPTVIFLDLELPRYDGVEALRALAARGCKASIVLTGLADSRVMIATRMIGESKGLAMADCIAKPSDLRDVRAWLTQLRQEDRRINKDSIEDGLNDQQFIAYFQPIISATEGGDWFIDRLEALVRWEHPTLGIVMPDEFIQEAEHFGLIGLLTEQVLSQTLEQLKGWQGAGLDLSCSINVPPSLMIDLEFPDRIAQSITDHRLDPGLISLEMTETATMQDRTTTMDVLARLRVKGIGLSLDDFGTGYSSLTRLYQMPFQEIKIDRSLGMNVPGSREANTIVGSLIELAHNLGLTVCTEGVETRAGLDQLEVMKSDRCQGFFISRAIPPAEVSGFVEQWNADGLASSPTQDVAAVI